ncbi:hypothetical protein [Rhizobium yanglingense]
MDIRSFLPWGFAADERRLTRTHREAKAKLHVAETRFRAVTEPAALPI